MSTIEGLFLGSLALQGLFWIRTRRVRSTSLLQRLLSLLERLPPKGKLLIGAVHLSVVLQVLAPSGENVIVLLQHAGAAESAAEERPSWNEAYRGSMSSPTVPRSEGTWRPAR